MRQKIMCLSMFVGVAAISCAAPAQTFTYAHTGLTVTSTNESWDANGVQLAIFATATNSSPTLTITPGLYGLSVSSVLVVVNRGSSTASRVVVSIASRADMTRTITRLGDVSSGGLPLILVVSNVGQLGFSETDRAQLTAASMGTMSVVKNVNHGFTGNAFADFAVTGITSPSVLPDIEGIVVGGDFIGGVTGANTLERVIVTGQIGSSTFNSSINARRLYRVEASSIRGSVSLAGTDNFIGQFLTTGTVATTPSSVTGSFIGSLTTGSLTTGGTALTSFIDISNNLDANISIAKDLTALEGNIGAAILVRNGEFAAGRTISIGRVILPGAGVNHGGIKIVNAQKLKGQVVVENINQSAAPWEAPVTVDGIVLGPTSVGDYKRASTDLGGGSVGLAPFYLNHEDCLPPSPCEEAPCWTVADLPPIVSQSTFASTGIKLRFYGPISVPDLASPALVYKATSRFGYPDTLIDAANFEFSTEASSGITRTLVLKTGSGVALDPGRYTVVYSSATNDILSQVTGTPSVRSFQYGFNLTDDSVVDPDQYCGNSDFNCDGDFGTDADIEAFFMCLAGSCAGFSCNDPYYVDFNGDGDTGTDADIEAFFRVLAGGHC